MYAISRRQRIARLLEARHSLTPKAISDNLEASDIDISPEEVVDDLEHIKQSLKHEDKTLEVAPPVCQDCDFSNFDKLLNIPSRCPNCKSLHLSDPEYRIVTSN